MVREEWILVTIEEAGGFVLDEATGKVQRLELCFLALTIYWTIVQEIHVRLQIDRSGYLYPATKRRVEQL